MKTSRNKLIVMTSDILFCSADDSKSQDVQFSIKNDKSIKSSHVRRWTRVCVAFIFPCLEKNNIFLPLNKQWHHKQTSIVSIWWHGADVVALSCLSFNEQLDQNE